MPPKRRSSNLSSPSLKKVKQELPSAEDLKSFLLSTLQLVTNLRDDNNRIISKEFYKLPSKKLYPDYYELIKEPISINEIKSKIINNKYTSSVEFLNDFKLMNSNAKTYNDSSSGISLDCDFILSFVQDQVKQFNGEDTEIPVKVEEEHEQTPQEEDEKDLTLNLKHLLYQCINYKPYKRNKISPPFMDVVDGEMYPDYYKIITKLMSFNTILQNLPNYSKDLNKFLQDVNLIWQNAQTYNDESSLIYQDSVKLCEYFYKKFGEFVEKTGVKISYEVPTPIITTNITDKVESSTAEGTPQPERKKRGRPRLENVSSEDPPPIDFQIDHDEDEELIDDDEDDDELELETKKEDDDDDDKIDEPEPILLSKLNSIKESNGVNKFIGYKRQLSAANTTTNTQPQDLFKNFIKSITISSSRILYKKTNLQDTEVGKFITSLEKNKPELTKFFQSSLTELFEYKFIKDDLSSTNFTLNLKNVNTLQINTMLNMQKIASQKFEQVLFFNGEKINASPSVYEFDDNTNGDSNDGNDDKLSSSKFDINLLPGLNSLEFVCKVGPIIMVDRNGKLPSRHATNPNNENNYITERCCIWITVDQF